MRYRILGPLSVTDDELGVSITAGRDRVVLAMLLLRARRVVSVGALVDAVWGTDPPATARGQLQTCISRLRRALPPGAIGSDPAGYRIDVRAGELDTDEFGRLVAAARGRHDAALYRQALDLWRGAALDGVDSDAVRQAATVLDDQYVAALESWADLELTAGRERDLIGELTAQVERFPLQERLRGQLMLALFRSGRQADALAEYRRAREVLRDELGLDPGAELSRLHQDILSGTLSGDATSDGVADAALVRCLPRTVADFTGRGAVVDRLVRTIDAPGSAGPVIAVIDGMAGSGKTTLALHVASLVGDRYPDAHLFVDLHGHSEREPVEPAAALLILLRQVGIEAERIPSELVERVALWRTELAKRRVLVLFDNAASSTQLVDLLPTGAGSLALVTGRRRLAGLDGVHHESLPVLADEEAITLLARIAGERVRVESAAAAEVVRRCGGLPLAIRLAGARLAHRPRWRVVDLVRRLGESVLPELAAEDRSVAAAFAVSYGQLAVLTRRVFRLLGLYPGADFDGLAVAALTGLSLAEAQDALDDLVDVHLIDEPDAGVFRLHDLLREFAAVLAAEIDAEERRAALRGLLDLQLHAAVATVLGGHRRILDRDLRSPVPLRPDLASAVADPLARLERERRNLIAYVDAAAAAGLPEFVWQLPRAAWLYLWTSGYVDEVESLLDRAVTAAEQIGDRSAVATAANYLASVHYRRSAIDEACRLLEKSIRIREELGDRHGMAITMGNLAGMHYIAGRWAKSIEVAHAARRLPTPWVSEDNAWLNVLAVASMRLGRYAEALRYQRLRLISLMEIGDISRIAGSLQTIAVLKHRTGAVSVAAARRQFEVAVRMLQRANFPLGESEALSDLARLLFAEGRLDEAVATHQRAIEMVVEQHDPRLEATVRHDYGTTLRLAGDLPAAREMSRRALELARQSRLPYLIATAQAGLAACLAESDPVEAARLWTRARDTFAELAAPERHEIEGQLAAFEAAHPSVVVA